VANRLTMCFGKAFGLGSQGELQPRSPQRKAWPYAGEPDQGNGLMLDDERGLWSPAAEQVKVVDFHTPPTDLTAGTGQQVEQVFQDVTITNPSKIAPLWLHGMTTYSMRVAMPLNFNKAGKGYEEGEFQCGARWGTGTMLYDLVASQQTGPDQGMTWTTSHCRVIEYTLPAGQTAVFKRAMTYKNVLANRNDHRWYSAGVRTVLHGCVLYPG
jgi:hypothetical protein